MFIQRSIPMNDDLTRDSLILQDDTKRIIRKAYIIVLLSYISLIISRIIVFNDHSFMTIVFGMIFILIGYPVSATTLLFIQDVNNTWRFIYYKKLPLFYFGYKQLEIQSFTIEVRTMKIKQSRFLKLIFYPNNNDSKYHFRITPNQVSEIREFADINEINIKNKRFN